MISVFGVVSFVVAAICIIVIFQQSRVMTRRTPVDQGLSDLEALVRQRLELLYTLSPPDTELFFLVDQCIDKDFDTILNSMPLIEEAVAETPLSKIEGPLPEKNDSKAILSKAAEPQPPNQKAALSESSESQVSTQKAAVTKSSELDVSTANIGNSISKLNKSIEAYNDYITTNSTGVMMALLLGIKTLDSITQLYPQSIQDETAQLDNVTQHEDSKHHEDNKHAE